MTDAIWAYPWDLLDAGTETALAQVTSIGLRRVLVAATYHAGFILQPNNPRARVRLLEDGVLYFRPTSTLFTGCALRPRTSRLVRQADPMEVIVAAAARHGVKVEAWVVALHNSDLGTRQPRFTVENAFGDRLPFSLCPSLSENRTYVRTLLHYLTSQYPLAGVRLEAGHFLSWRHDHHHFKVGFPLGDGGDLLLSLCFCRGCSAASKAAGVDPQAMRRRVKEALLSCWRGAGEPLTLENARAAVPQLDAYRAVRASIVLEFIEAVRAACRSPLSIAVPFGSLGRPDLTGLDISRLAGRADSISLNCHYPDPARIGKEVRAARSLLPADLALAANINAADPTLTDQAEFRAGVQAAREAGANTIAFYNYGLLPLGRLAWIASTQETPVNAPWRGNGA